MFERSRRHAVTANQDELAGAFLSVRRAMGLAGLALPVILYIDARVLPGGQMQPSISEFYHTVMGDLFVGILSAIGLFLISYVGHAPRRDERLTDWSVSNAAGIGALGTALFPTLPPGTTCGEEFTAPADPQGFVFHWCTIWEPLHFLSAGLFFVAMAVFCLFLFPKGKDGVVRYFNAAGNVVYLLCGIVLLVAIAGLLYYFFVHEEPRGAALRSVNFVFWFETLGIVAFAIAWLTKGNILGGIGNMVARRSA